MSGPRRSFWAIVKVVEMRLRMIVVMAVTGLAFGYWDTLAYRIEAWSRPPRQDRGEARRVEHYCPMHPSVVLEAPSSCPICGMPLARREPREAAVPDGSPSRVRLTPGQVAQAGVRTVEVGLGRREEEWSTVGYVGYDESRRFQVASNTRGHLRVDRLHARSEGVIVQQGERLAELYGYDVAQAIRLYLDAIAARRAGAGERDGTLAAPAGDPEERVRLAADGLRVLGIRQDQIRALEAGNPAAEALPLLAPIGGHLVRKAALEGQYVAEGEVLYEIADLSRVWILAQVFEDQLGRVEVGRRIEATVPAFPGETFAGRIAMIAPALDAVTRTAAVRFEIDNPGYRLRPGMFAAVTLRLSPVRGDSRERLLCPVSGLALGSMGRAQDVDVDGRTVRVCCAGCIPKLKSNPTAYLRGQEPSSDDMVLCVPASAVIDTGSARVVYVESSPGIFEGRSVSLGVRMGDRYPVLSGLVSGERIAAAGAFLIDAETRLSGSPGSTP
ncbi:efflux RND transporter periplasmic adaptor subunit [Aquisphaera insulae]|uniref:efflux RND transporter periplasmic adaptor subunit n=1 Tax=Aquisphaera insulae TaxID=2712864 RepID=UPI0013EB1836|nr:efflux RND transporter periplasmic adaptor subunit [Aquisphaera insulae]